MITSCDTIKRSMNEAGRTKTPFLFGLDFELSEGFFIENPLRQSEILFDMDGTGNVTETTEGNPFAFVSFPENYRRYARRFSHVMEGLRYGNSFLTNLTIKTPVETGLSLKEIFLRSRAKYRLYVPGRFVCFSPERFVRIGKGKIFSHPMKGTIDASVENAEETILNDYKEKAEHCTIVDLIRNDISRIATRVKVSRFRYIDRVETNEGAILQVSSEIEGTLPGDYLENLGTLFFELLPAGSVSGAPKEATVAIIREAEQEPRGFYTGVAGYFDGTGLDSCVLIRYIEQTEGGFYFRSGGGITVNSECEKEYAEAVRKIYLPFT